VATASELHVYELDGTLLSSTPRVSGPIAAMVAVDFDPGLGEDLMLAIGDQRVLHPSTGLGGLGEGELESGGLSGLAGLAVADTGQSPVVDLYGWGQSGYFALRGDLLNLFPGDPVDWLVAFDGLTPGQVSYVVRRGSSFDGYDGLDDYVAFADGLDPGLPELVRVRGPSGNAVANLAQRETFSRLQLRSELDGWALAEWSIPGLPHRVLSANLDGLGNDELIYLYANGGLGDGVVLEFDPDGVGDCLVLPGLGSTGPWNAAAVGDPTGDGREAVALLSGSGELVLID
jgi:hypothetical protein